MRPDRVQSEPAGVTAGKSFSGSNTLLKKFLQRVHRYERDNLYDVRVRIAGVADRFQIGITDRASCLNDLARKLDGSVPPRINGVPLPSESYFIGRKLGHMLGRKAMNG